MVKINTINFDGLKDGEFEIINNLILKEIKYSYEIIEINILYFLISRKLPQILHPFENL